MKWMTVTAALVVGASLNSADAGLFDCCKKKNDCCQQQTCCQPAPQPCCTPAPQCCQPAPQPCCTPAPAPTCCAPVAPAPSCCAPVAPSCGAPIPHGVAPLPPGEGAPAAPVAEPVTQYGPQPHYYTVPRDDKGVVAETWDSLKRFERKKNKTLMKMIGLR